MMYGGGTEFFLLKLHFYGSTVARRNVLMSSSAASHWLVCFLKPKSQNSPHPVLSPGCVLWYKTMVLLLVIKANVCFSPHAIKSPTSLSLSYLSETTTQQNKPGNKPGLNHNKIKNGITEKVKCGTVSPATDLTLTLTVYLYLICTLSTNNYGWQPKAQRHVRLVSSSQLNV